MATFYVLPSRPLVGRRFAELLGNLPPTSLGEGSIHHRLWNAGARLCRFFERQGMDVACPPAPPGE